MNKSLANTVGERINEFDNLEVKTVGMFNELFPECPIKDKPLTSRVMIVHPEPNNCRMILVGSEVIHHKMYSDILYTLDREEFHMDERETELNEINGVPV